VTTVNQLMLLSIISTRPGKGKSKWAFIHEEFALCQWVAVPMRMSGWECDGP
jgi:hypothetical protein